MKDLISPRLLYHLTIFKDDFLLLLFTLFLATTHYFRSVDLCKPCLHPTLSQTISEF